MDESNVNPTLNVFSRDAYRVAPQSASEPTTPSGVVYATFFERLVAIIIDGVLVGITGFIIELLFWGLLMHQQGGNSTIDQLLNTLFIGVYSVYFITQKGQTLGKKAMHLRVQNETTGQNLDVVSAILREVVGKFLSGAVMFLGYLWVLWDPKKQTWHDKIAKSIVVKVK